MAPVKGSCKKGVFGRCFGAVSTATFFSLETRRKKKDSMRQRTEKREKFSFFYKRDFPQFSFAHPFYLKNKKGQEKKKTNGN